MGEEVAATDYRVNSRPFNSPLETGLRALFVLNAVAPEKSDLQRLIFYDYLVVHSADPEGPPSLHAAVPHRSGEWLVRRELLALGLDLMFSKELLVKSYEPAGVFYSASELTAPFLQHLQSAYSMRLSQLAQWVGKQFQTYTDAQLSSYMNEHLGRWGAEFNRESILRRVAI